DDALGDEVRVTVIAAGFDSGQLPYKKVEIRRESAESAPATPAPAGQPTNGSSRPSMVGVGSASGGQHSAGQSWSPTTTGSGTSGRRAVELDEELDVPDFLK
ncbi:MAG TPA: hypothetical protein VH298_07100, partial [Jatrophihabitans sp.]|nr:hypothetical protein [Jatrophihabitans sp.]